MGTHYDNTSKVSVGEKAELFGLKTRVVDGNDVEEVYKNSVELISHVKKNSEPALIECKTYRWMGHSAFDNRPYRPKEEVKKWKEKDPIKRYKAKLLKDGIGEDEIKKREDAVEKAMAEAADFALKSDYPEFDDSLIQ
jgi:TPP-dependent pyruvate/acetoin dehydrogenase alpha subunit